MSDERGFAPWDGGEGNEDVERSAVPPATEDAAPTAHLAPGELEPGRGRARRLHPSYVTAARLAALVFVGFVGVASTAGAAAMWLLSDLSTPWKSVVAGLIAAQFLVVGLLSLHWPVLEFARTSYRVGREGIEIKRGVVWRHVVTVPRSRIQHTDVAQGPIQRRFGLATLVVHTAGTHEYEVTLSGIGHDVALRVRDALLEDEEGDGRGDR